MAEIEDEKRADEGQNFVSPDIEQLFSLFNRNRVRCLIALAGQLGHGLACG
jgi:hypothetical protein